MARQWFIPGADALFRGGMIDDNGTREYFIPGVGMFAEGATVQIAVPISDVSSGGWTPSFAGSPTELFAMLDETVADDSDYIESALTPTADTCEVQLQSLDDPLSSGDHIVRYRYQKDQADGQVDLTVKLMEGASTIATWAHTDISASWVTVAQTLSGAEADSITDYADLRLRFTADQP